MLKKFFINAKIIFATTTTMNPNGVMGVNPRSTEEIDEYNKLAIEKAKAEGILINDLNAFVKEWGSEMYEDYCHYTKDAFECLGEHVAQFLKNCL